MGVYRVSNVSTTCLVAERDRTEIESYAGTMEFLFHTYVCIYGAYCPQFLGVRRNCIFVNYPVKCFNMLASEDQCPLGSILYYIYYSRFAGPEQLQASDVPS